MSAEIKVGDKVPQNASLRYVAYSPAVYADAKDCGLPVAVSSGDFFKGKTVVLFAVPGPFTPACHLQHAPGYVEKYAELKGKGVDTIACLSTADAFVQYAWGKQLNVTDKIIMISDGNSEFIKAAGLSQDLSKIGFGASRPKRFLLIVKDGIVQHVAVGDLDVSSAEAALSKL